MKFSSAAAGANFEVLEYAAYRGVTFIGNLIGGGLLMGLPYAWFNKTEKKIAWIKMRPLGLYFLKKYLDAIFCKSNSKQRCHCISVL